MSRSRGRIYFALLSRFFASDSQSLPTTPMTHKRGKPFHKRRESSKLTRQDLSNIEEDEGHASDSTNEPTVRKKVRWEAEADITDNASSHESDSSEDREKTDKAICLTCFCVHGRVGCSYYDPVKRIVYILEDTQETPPYDLVKMVLEQASPDVVFTSSKSDDEFVSVLREHMDMCNGSFQIRPYKEFTPTKGRERLLSLHLLSDLSVEDVDIMGSSSDAGSSTEPTSAYDFMRRRRDATGDPILKKWNASIRLSNFVSLDCAPLCLSSIGALLDYMIRRQAESELDDEGIGGLDIRNIEILALNQVMHINADALFSLQIFEHESHASVHSDKTKEGLSLFGILNNTRTSLGRSLMRTWLLRPSLSLAIIRARHDAVECFLRSENLVTADSMHNHLKGMKYVPKMLTALKNGKASLSDWQGLLKFTYHATMLRDACADLFQTSSVDIAQKAENLVSCMDVGSFRDVGVKINEIIDWEESAVSGRVCVKPHIDKELDDRKHIYHGIDSILSKVAQQLSPTVPPDYATSLNVVYFPQLGFLICIPMMSEWTGEEGIQVLDGWSFQFCSDTHVYFKSKEMIDMDVHIGDLHPAIVDREIEIVQNLQDEVLKYDRSITTACDVCAELDCLLCFAEASRTYEYRRPMMVEENIIDIVQGRHPLQEQVVDTFVANDAYVVGGTGLESVFAPDDADTDASDSDTRTANSVLICTGANACGKSVYLKQIALIQYMAQVGCFVPAESATLGVVDKIFTRIQTRESVSKLQSAFMIDLNQVSLALRNATVRSLVVLDEFGKGTVSTDGAGLFCGVISNLLSRGSSCPKVLAATHFHEVMFTSDDGEPLDPRGYEPESADDNVNMILPGCYLRVASGLSLESHAAKCAEMFGIPRGVVHRAQYVTQLLYKNELGRLLDEDMTTQEKEDLRDAEEVCRRYLAWNFDNDSADQETVKGKLRCVVGRKFESDGQQE